MQAGWVRTAPAFLGAGRRFRGGRRPRSCRTEASTAVGRRGGTGLSPTGSPGGARTPKSGGASGPPGKGAEAGATVCTRDTWLPDCLPAAAPTGPSGRGRKARADNLHRASAGPGAVLGASRRAVPRHPPQDPRQLASHPCPPEEAVLGEGTPRPLSLRQSRAEWAPPPVSLGLAPVQQPGHEPSATGAHGERGTRSTPGTRQDTQSDSSHRETVCPSDLVQQEAGTCRTTGNLGTCQSKAHGPHLKGVGRPCARPPPVPPPRPGAGLTTPAEWMPGKHS